MIILYFKGFWTLEDIRSLHDHLFVFGDNDIRKGKGGQAIIRDEPNAHGIPTKKLPLTTAESYYTDTEYEKNVEKIDAAIKRLKKKALKYKAIVLPENGIGTGLARLEEKAPKTFAYLQSQLQELT